MGCCGDNRRTLSVEPANAPHRGWSASPAPNAPPAEIPLNGADLRLRYSGAGNILVKGPFSGRSYSFAAGRSEQVDPRDGDALLRTGLFIRE
jgi:hypothetical protein